MNFKELSYKINNVVFGPNEVLGVFVDGIRFTLKYRIVVSEHKIHVCYLTCPVEDVEVLYGT